VLAEGIIPALREHLAGVRLTHEEDLRAGGGAVYLPGALDRKYPNAAREWGWQYFFPARDVSTTMIYTHVLQQGGQGVPSPLDL
jgi:hypothetical protein